MAGHGGRQGRRRRRQRQTPSETIEEIARLHSLGHTPAEIFRLLEHNEYLAGTASARTIQRIIREDLSAPPDDSGPWSFATAEDPTTARHAMDMLAYVSRESSGRVTQLTQREAEWAIRLLTAYPDMPRGLVWEWARMRIAQEASGDPTLPGDLWLAYTPWESEKHAQQYERVFGKYPYRERVWKAWDSE
jgi:hypothetical protein